MGQITVNLPNETFTVKIAGDTPTIEEELKLAELVRSKRRSATTRRQQARFQEQAEQERSIDTTSGIKDASLRATLGAAENNEEKEKALRNIYGLGEGDYFQDRLGNFGITKSGGTKLGIDLERDTMIDEEGFSRYDLADLGTVGLDIAGGVGGTLGGAALGTAILPGIGTFIGGVLGAGLGTAGAGLAEEGVEALAGMSAQTAEEIAKDAGVNFLIGAGSELAIGGAIKIVAPYFRGTKGAALPEEDLILAGQSIDEFGIKPNIGIIGGSPILARQQKISQKALGGSKMLKDNYDSMMRTIDGYKSQIGVPVGQATDEEAGRALIASIASKNAALKNAEREAKESIINTFDSVAVDMGAAATKDENLNQAVFASLATALKNFDDMSATKYAAIDSVVGKAAGGNKILDTSLLKAQAKNLKDEYGPAIQAAGLSPSPTSEALAARSIIQGFEDLPKNASFSQMYNLRRQIFDNSFSFRGSGGGDLLRDAIQLVDNLMTPAALEAATLRAGKAISSDDMALLTQAAAELPEARKFFRQGMDAIDSMEAATGVRNLLDAVRSGNIPPNVDFVKALIRTGQPEALKQTLNVVSKNAGADAAEDLRRRLAGEYLRGAVSKTGVKGDDLAFNGSSFSTVIDELGATGKVLFGDNLDEIKGLANQIRLTTIPRGTANADVEKALSALQGNRAPDALVNTLRNLADAQKETLKLKNNTIFTQIANNSPDATVQAAGLVARPGASASNIRGIMNVLDDTQKEQVRAFYMRNLLQDFGSDVMIRGEALKKFAKAITDASEGGKLQAIFGKEMGDNMTKFGRILEFNARTVDGGDLVAANIAASPLENIGKIIRLFFTGNILSSAPIYKRVVRDYKNLQKGISPKEKAASLGRIIGSAFAQTPTQLLQEGAETTEEQIKFAIESLNTPTPAPASGIAAVNVNQPLTPSPAPVTPSPAPVQAIGPVTGTNVPIGARGTAGTATTGLRQMATNNPAIAQALGIRGATAGLL